MSTTRTHRVRFKGDSRLWLARQNEAWFCWEAAARLYRELGMKEDAERCEAAKARESKTVPTP